MALAYELKRIKEKQNKRARVKFLEGAIVASKIRVELTRLREQQ